MSDNLRVNGRDINKNGIRAMTEWCVTHGSDQMMAEAAECAALATKLAQNGELWHAAQAAQESARYAFGQWSAEFAQVSDFLGFQKIRDGIWRMEWASAS